MALKDLTMENLISEKMTYVVPTTGKIFDKREDAEQLILNTCNIGQYYKFYEIFYSPSTTDRNKRYEKFMMIMTRRTIAIHNEVLSYLTNTLGLNPVTYCGDFGGRDTFIINENPDLKTASLVFNQIKKDMSIHNGLEAGGGVYDIPQGTLHLIDASGKCIYVDTPENSMDIFKTFVNFDESKLNPIIPEEQKQELDSLYI